MILSFCIAALALFGVIATQVWTVMWCVRLLARLKRPTLSLGAAMGLLVLVHLAEIIIFGCAFQLGCETFELGRLNVENPVFGHYIYYSFTTFTTVGYGDVVAQGPITLLAGVEALTGSMLMASSATITFFVFKQQVLDHAFDGR